MGCEGQTTSRLKRTTATSRRLVNDSMHFIPLPPVIIEAFVVTEFDSRPMRIWRYVMMMPFAFLRLADDRNYYFAARAQRAVLFLCAATSLSSSATPVADPTFVIFAHLEDRLTSINSCRRVTEKKMIMYAIYEGFPVFISAHKRLVATTTFAHRSG